MIQRKKKRCIGCDTDQYLYGHQLCTKCYNKKKREEKKEKYLRKPKSKIKPVSKKQTSDLNKYGKVRAEYLREHPCCEVGLPGCGGCDTRMLQIHHKKGRIGDLLTNKKYFLTVCYDCHIYIEAHPALARENGWSLSRLSNEEMTDDQTNIKYGKNQS